MTPCGDAAELIQLSIKMVERKLMARKSVFRLLQEMHFIVGHHHRIQYSTEIPTRKHDKIHNEDEILNPNQTNVTFSAIRHLMVSTVDTFDTRDTHDILYLFTS